MQFANVGCVDLLFNFGVKLSQFPVFKFDKFNGMFLEHFYLASHVLIITRKNKGKKKYNLKNDVLNFIMENMEDIPVIMVLPPNNFKLSQDCKERKKIIEIVKSFF